MGGIGSQPVLGLRRSRDGEGGQEAGEGGMGHLPGAGTRNCVCFCASFSRALLNDFRGVRFGKEKEHAILKGDYTFVIQCVLSQTDVAVLRMDVTPTSYYLFLSIQSDA